MNQERSAVYAKWVTTEMGFIAVILTSAALPMYVVPMQPVLTLMGHSLAPVIPVMMVTE